jgi:general secretion pathway protein G
MLIDEWCDAEARTEWSTTQAIAAALRDHVGRHYLEFGQFPPNLAQSGFDGPLDDAWSRPLIYEHTAATFANISYGRDGTPGGEGPDADIRVEWPEE